LAPLLKPKTTTRVLWEFFPQHKLRTGFECSGATDLNCTWLEGPVLTRKGFRLCRIIKIGLGLLAISIACTFVTDISPATAGTSVQVVGCIVYDPQTGVGSTLSDLSKIDIGLPSAGEPQLVAYEGKSIYQDGNLILIGPPGWQCSEYISRDSISLVVRPTTGRNSKGYAEVLVFSEGTDQAGDKLNLSYAEQYFPNVVSKSYVSSFYSQNFASTTTPVTVRLYGSDALNHDSRAVISFVTRSGHYGIGLDILKQGLPSVNHDTPAVSTFGFLRLNTGSNNEKLVCDMTFYAARLPKTYAASSEVIKHAVANAVPTECAY
jgi:hypothetical protein